MQCSDLYGVRERILFLSEGAAMKDEAMIRYFASEWIALGGDADGFAYTQSKILEELRRRETEEDSMKAGVREP